MKVFFDTGVLIAEALLGRGAQRMVNVTRRARWRMYTSTYVVDEVVKVLTEDLGFTRRFALLTRRRVMRRSTLVKAASRAQVPEDPDDSPILQAALTCGADFLVTNDRHLLTLDPFEGLHIISMDAYHDLLEDEGLLK
jgi:putative PIN family toxin of toxin-antitoxin system